MDYLLVCAVALLASGLTLFSGFGLGTLLLPAFALFFPIPTAIAMTAVVHLSNNLFKLALVGRNAHFPTVLRFGITAVPAAWLGAQWLHQLEGLAPVFRYTIGGSEHLVTPIGLCVGSLLLAFAVLESLPAFAELSFPAKWLPLGGALSGFFGGLSGQQGALRSAFLMRAGLSKQGYIGTGVALACLVDLTRLPVYAGHLARVGEKAGLVVAAILFAWAGAFFGARMLQKVTDAAVQRIVAALLILVGILMGAGII